ncbi:MAG: PASTA domain-containing protein [Egibacteraceae bacterium]
MTALLIVGVALGVFGALVLLKFPDRPGGTIRVHRMEVSSTGAGLPLIALGIAVMVLSASGAGTSSGGPAQRPITGRSPTSSSSPKTPAVVGNYVGRLVDPVTRELEASGVLVTEVPVVDESKREGEIVAQDPAPGQPLSGQTTLDVVRNPGRIDLVACCLHFIGGGRYNWNQAPAIIVRTRYDHTLRWPVSHLLGYGEDYEDGVAIVLPADQRIVRLTGVIGIANDADISSTEEATVIIRIDGTDKPRETVTVLNPLSLDLNVADVARVEIFFISGFDTPVVIADLTGHQG